MKDRKVSICKKDICIHADGKNGDMLATAVSAFALFAGIAAIIKAASSVGN